MKNLIRRSLGRLGYEIRRKPLPGNGPRNGAGEHTPFADYLARTDGMVSPEEASLLYELAREMRDGCIVEVGSYRGRSTVALGRGSLDGHRVPVFAIEPHEEFAGILGGKFGPADRGAFYQAMLDSSCYLVVRLINLSSECVAPLWKTKVSLLWIDGDHTYEGVNRDFTCWHPHLARHAIVALDDSLEPELGPRRLLNELTMHGEFAVLHEVGKVTVLGRQGT